MTPRWTQPSPTTQCDQAVGAWVYRRIEVLMGLNNGKGPPVTALSREARELEYLAALVAEVEEYGATGEEYPEPFTP